MIINIPHPSPLSDIESRDCSVIHQTQCSKIKSKVITIGILGWCGSCFLFEFATFCYFYPWWTFLFSSITVLITVLLWVKYRKNEKRALTMNLSADDAKAAEVGASKTGIAFIKVDNPPSYNNIAPSSPAPSYKSGMLHHIPTSPAPSYKSDMLHHIPTSPAPSYKSGMLHHIPTSPAPSYKSDIPPPRPPRPTTPYP